jgi:ABC-type lipoprotein export system ATPase subunit
MAVRTERSNSLVVEARGIERVYKLQTDDVHALRGVDLAVRPGEFVTLIGRSGSGKTTLLNILAGLDRPTKGSVTLAGRETTDLSDEAVAALRRENMGIIFQSSALLPLLTAAENVELPLRIIGWARGERERRAREVLDRVGLLHRARHRPYELSGGEQQRVAIARAIAPRPRLLLADEPTGELDSLTAQAIFRLFRSLVDDEQVAILAATHDRAIIQQADRVLQLRDGLLTDITGRA